MILFAVSMFLCQSAMAAVNILQCDGWFESGYITWSPVDGATNYDVYVKATSANDWTKLDKELVRKYSTYYRADAVGLKAGSYQFKVEANNGESATSNPFTATAHDRSGFAHVGMPGGIGAYKNDGTLKDGAKVLYVWADNAKTVSTTVAINSKGGTATAIGLQDIIYWYQKGYEKTPLAIRIIGTIKAADMDRFDSSAEGLQVKGNSNYSEVPITMEGIGSDAAIHGFGILVRGCHSTEFRNFAIMLCMDDCLSLDTGNSNVWVHNMDFFYGSTGGDADQAKGDGTVDIKGLSKNCTVSYNHFFDSGKCSLGGMKSETTDCWMSYHHNWFDHSDSRHPRIRTAFYHVYNNYYDGNSKYGVGVTSGGSAFVENNYFRNCKYPMLISKQGTDALGDGTFSGELGGVIKAYNNTIVGAKGIMYYTAGQTDGKWDAVKVDNRNADVTAKALIGGSSYNSSADLAARTTYIENKMEDPSTVPTTVKSALGAGRMNHGDFNWKFNNAEDTNDKVITDLKNALISYKSTLVGFADGTSIKNGGATSTVDGGQAPSDSDNPTWGEDTPSDEETTIDEKPYISSANGSDYYWFNSENAEEINAWLANGTITLKDGTVAGSTTSSFNQNYEGNANYPAEHTGSLQLAKASAQGNATSGGTCTFYCPNGVTAFELYTLRTGSTYYIVQTSTDGKNFNNIDKIEKAPSGIYEKDYTGTINSTSAIWIRIINTSTGGLNIQGVRINQPAEANTDEPAQPGMTETKVCYFTSSTKTASSDMVAVSGNYSNSKGSVSYGGTVYKDCVKMETVTSITITPEGNCDVTLIFKDDNNASVAGKGINLDGTKKTLDSNGQYTFEATANSTYTLTKGDSMNLFLVIFTPKQSSEEKPTIVTLVKEIGKLQTDSSVTIDSIEKMADEILERKK